MGLKDDWAKAKKHFEQKSGSKKPDAGFFSHASGVEGAFKGLDEILSTATSPKQVKPSLDSVVSKASAYADVLDKAAKDKSKGTDYQHSVAELKSALDKIVADAKKQAADKEKQLIRDEEVRRAILTEKREVDEAEAVIKEMHEQYTELGELFKELEAKLKSAEADAKADTEKRGSMVLQKQDQGLQGLRRDIDAQISLLRRTGQDGIRANEPNPVGPELKKRHDRIAKVIQMAETFSTNSDRIWKEIQVVRSRVRDAALKDDGLEELR